MWTDGSRLDSGYSVVWGHSPNGWRGVKTHMGYNQEACDAECAALVRALDLVADRQRRGNSGGSRFSRALEQLLRACRHAKLALASSTPYKRARPWKEVVEIRWCPAHSGIEGNEKSPTATASSGSDTATTNGEVCPYQHPSPT